MRAKWACVLLGFTSISAVAAVPPQTLEDSYRNALKRSEAIGTATELIVQAEETYRQDLGSILPNLSLVGSYLQQQNPGGAASTSFPSSQPLVKLTLTQPIFHGLRDLAALRQAGMLKDATGDDARQARVTLYINVATNVYTILALEKTMENYSREIVSYENWIKELRQRIKIGRSRETEVLTVEASLTGVQAQIELAKGQLRVNREAYAFLTGLPADTPIVDDQPLVREFPAVDFYIAGIEQRPDVKAAYTRQLATEQNIPIARGQNYPQVDFTGDYYMVRYGDTKGVNWDFQVLATLPLYAGGKIDSSVRQADSQFRQSELATSLTRRSADTEVRSDFQTYVADRSQVEAIQKNREVSEKNVKVQMSDYRLGLVTNLDVLSALVQYQQSILTLDQTIFTTKLDYIKLQNASAKNPEIDRTVLQ